jgi:hypothetical protein
MREYTDDLKLKIATRYERIAEIEQEVPQKTGTISALKKEINEFEKMLHDPRI